MKSIEQKLKGDLVGKSRVLKITPKKDEKGSYLPICTYQHHPGVIFNNRRCIKLKCKYYKQVYISNVS